MNKVLSQAIKKAVSEFSPQTQENHLDKRPDLFSLNNETELFEKFKCLKVNLIFAIYKSFLFYFTIQCIYYVYLISYIYK